MGIRDYERNAVVLTLCGSSAVNICFHTAQFPHLWDYVTLRLHFHTLRVLLLEIQDCLIFLCSCEHGEADGAGSTLSACVWRRGGERQKAPSHMLFLIWEGKAVLPCGPR